MTDRRLTSPIEGFDDAPSATDHYPLTFGAEFEFALAYIQPLGTIFTESALEDPNPEDPRPVNKIVHGTGVSGTEQVNIHIRNTLDDHFGFQRALAHFVDNPEHGKVNADYWYITTDFTVKRPKDAPAAYSFTATEVNTPALLFGLPALDEVEYGLRKLLTTYRMNTNPTTSLHVHVGFGTHSYQLQELKQIMAVWWVFEKQFFSLVASHRHDNVWCRKVRSASFLAEIIQTASPNLNFEERTRKGLEMILDAENRKTLIKYFEPGDHIDPDAKNVAMNLMNLLLEQDSKQTIEFRLHEGCLNPETTRAWLSFCCGIVMFACVARPEKLTTWLEVHASEAEGEYFVGEVLRDMKLTMLADFFEKKIQCMKSDEEQQQLEPSWADEEEEEENDYTLY